MNQINLMGRLTKDPEFTMLNNGNGICKLSIAYSEKYNGNEKTSFFDAVAFGKTADNINKYFSKGQRILINGKIQQETWQSKEGQNRSKVSIIINQFDFIESAKSNNNQIQEQSFSNDFENESQVPF